MSVSRLISSLLSNGSFVVIVTLSEFPIMIKINIIHIHNDLKEKKRKEKQRHAYVHPYKCR